MSSGPKVHVITEEELNDTGTNGAVATAPDEEIAPPAPSPEDLLRTRDSELAATKEQLLRMAADFDNFRKRARKESDDLRKFAIENVLQDILPVLDNLDRALVHSMGDTSPTMQGVRMVQKQFLDVLGRYNVQAFLSLGKPFDPERHEAVGQVPTRDQQPGTVMEEFQKGYTLHDRLLRPARVSVAAAIPDVTSDSNTESEPEVSALS